MANVENLLKTPTFQQLPLRGHFVRSAFPLGGPIVAIDFPVLGAFGTNGPIVVLFPHTTSGLRFCLAQPSFAHPVFQEPVSILRYALSHFTPRRHRAMRPILSNFLIPAYFSSIHSWQSLSISIIQ